MNSIANRDATGTLNGMQMFTKSAQCASYIYYISIDTCTCMHDFFVSQID